MHTRTHTHTQKLQYVQYHCSFVSGFRRPQLRTTHFSLAASLFSPDGEGSLCLSGLPSERARGSACACATVFDFLGGAEGLKQRRTWSGAHQSAAHSCALHLPSPILSFYSSWEHQHSLFPL